MGLTALLLAGAFYLTYRIDPSPACESDGTCHPRATTTARTLLWLVTAVVLLLLTFPYYMNLFV